DALSVQHEQIAIESLADPVRPVHHDRAGRHGFRSLGHAHRSQQTRGLNNVRKYGMALVRTTDARVPHVWFMRRRTDRAALNPPIPWAPAPGGVAAEQM